MKLAPIFNHHMVFAANKPILIWGQGKGEITVRFAEFEQTVKAQNGVFSLHSVLCRTADRTC